MPTKVQGSSTPKAWGLLMHTMGRTAPRRLSELRRLGKQTRALTAKPSKRKR